MSYNFVNDLIRVMKKNITFLLTLYKPTDKQLKYWSEKSKLLVNMGFDFFVLIDNPKLSISGFDHATGIVKNKKNRGKFKTVYKFVKTGKIKTSHFKVVDPDDGIIEYFLKDFNVESTDGILLMQNRIRTIDNLDKLYRRHSFGNSWTILPVRYLYNDNYLPKLNRMKNWLEDQLLGVISQINGY